VCTLHPYPQNLQADHALHPLKLIAFWFPFNKFYVSHVSQYLS
jgi:hypothetical protein